MPRDRRPIVDPQLPGGRGDGLGRPLVLGPVRLRNRFVSAPMERNYCEIDGSVTSRYVEYLARRARGGAALVFAEAAYVRADGKGRLRQLGVDMDARVPGLARLAAAVRAGGALFGVELNHGGRTAQGAVSGFQPVAPPPSRACPPVVNCRASCRPGRCTSWSKRTRKARAAAARRAWR
ncbi:hypothetical protein AB0I81_33850 [Nonomuraea sp. NPDC050404]|uniref:oxidoreductase n=1 Tax=Nonomuraea sp. NPDC050404 TaxID=3155783 RepID=UPI0033EC8571